MSENSESMADKRLTLKLTEEQQNQIKRATGKTPTELEIDLNSSGGLSDQELDQVSGGAYLKVKFTDYL